MLACACSPARVRALEELPTVAAFFRSLPGGCKPIPSWPNFRRAQDTQQGLNAHNRVSALQPLTMILQSWSDSRLEVKIL